MSDDILQKLYSRKDRLVAADNFGPPFVEDDGTVVARWDLEDLIYKVYAAIGDATPARIAEDDEQPYEATLTVEQAEAMPFMRAYDSREVCRLHAIEKAARNVLDEIRWEEYGFDGNYYRILVPSEADQEALAVALGLDPAPKEYNVIY
jgi:hypothetical protein